MIRTFVGSAIVALAAAGVAVAAPTRSSPLAVAADGHVFVVNPDSNTVARLAFDANHVGTLTHEAAVGAYPRTLALAGSWVFTADQTGDTVSRLDQADLGARVQTDLGAGCSPYGVAATPAGDGILVTCQGTSELVLLDTGLGVTARVHLPWPNARAIAVGDGGKAYVTHFLTEEPGTEAHVSVVDLAQKSVATVFAIPADATTCETQNSGQGPLNLVSAIAIVPAGPLAGQLWVGGTQENNVSKGLFKRFPGFKGQPGAALFPLVTFTPFPEPAPPKRKHRKTKPLPFPDAAASRNKYKASFHDITRFGIYKLDGGDGHVVGKLDIDEANNASDIEFSADGTVAFVVDHMFDSFHVFNTRKGQDGDVTTLFAPPSANGPGGANPTHACIPDALRSVTGEGPFRMAPEAQIVTIDGYNPVRFDASEPDPAQRYKVVNTGLDFDTATFMSTGTSQMRAVPDGVGTAPFGVRLAPDGQAVYVANYLARNVVVAASAAPTDGASGKPANFRCSANVGQTCGTNNDCARGGFCNHPGGAPCTTDADCGTKGPCVQSSDCFPLLLADPVLTVQTESANPGCVANDTIAFDGTPVAVCDPLYPALLDGKTLFNTAARDSSVPNQTGLDQAAPLFNAATATGKVPGSVVSTSHDASYVTCSTCHADFGGQDGRTWDFSQLGPSLRNSMDLRGRPGFAPGRCSNAPATECFFDAACGDGNVCQMRPDLVPANIPAGDRARYFNPMLTIHWNGDRDEVEDFEHTYRTLMGAGDCDGFEDTNDFDPATGKARGCLGALVQRSPATSSDPVDVNDDLAAPNRNLPGKVHPDKVVGIRLTHVADFVYSLTDFVKNPNPPTAATERGRLVFNDPQTKCAQCHNSAPVTGARQFFTDKRPRRPEEGFDPGTAAGADRNNPFLRNNVGTANLFDTTDPNAVAQKTQSFTNAAIPIPAPRGTLGDYVTPVLNDVWNTAPYLHDGSAPFLLDVVRACDTSADDCLVFGRGRNPDDKHGVTSILTPQQLNDLTAFQKTLTVDTKVGTGDQVVFAGTLALSAARVAFARRGGGAFRVEGLLSSAPGPLDPAAGVTLSLATPGGETMAILSRAVALKAKGKGFAGRTTTAVGTAVVKLRDVGGGRLRLAASGKGADVGTLDTGRTDLTVALEVPLANAGKTANFVKTRTLRGKKRVFQLARRGR